MSSRHSVPPSITSEGTKLVEKTRTIFSDRLTGTAGEDTIYGLIGNDTIHGLAGRDTLWGGIGNDLLDGGNGSDTITDYEVGTDIIRLETGAAVSRHEVRDFDRDGQLDLKLVFALGGDVTLLGVDSLAQVTFERGEACCRSRQSSEPRRRRHALRVAAESR